MAHNILPVVICLRLSFFRVILACATDKTILEALLKLGHLFSKEKLRNSGK